MITIHPLGFILAVIFAVSMGGLMWWMFKCRRLFPLPSPERGSRWKRSSAFWSRRSGTYLRGEKWNWPAGWEQDQKAEILLAYLLEVPRTLPLDAAMPDEEAKARRPWSWPRPSSIFTVFPPR